MNEPSISSAERLGGPNGRWLLLAAAFVVVVAGLRAAAPFLLPILLASFLALLSFPVVRWLNRHGIRLGLAVVVTVLAELGVVVVLGFVISRALNDFAVAAPGYAEQLVERAREGVRALTERGLDLSAFLAFEKVDPGALFPFARGILGGTVKGVAWVVSYLTLVLVILICALLEGAGLPDKLRLALEPTQFSPRYLSGVARNVQRYLGVKTVMSAVTGITLGLWVWALGVPFPLVWGLLAFALNYVPSIGSIIASIPAFLLTLIQYGIGRALIVIAGYLVVNFLVGYVIEPILMGRRFGLSTLVVFLSLIFWGWVWGLVGMLLSVPLTMVVKIILEQSEDFRWVALLLGPSPTPSKPPTSRTQ